MLTTSWLTESKHFRTHITDMVNTDEHPDAVIEAQLAHSVNDSLGQPYNRTELIDQRKDMMQSWANYLDPLKETKKTRR